MKNYFFYHFSNSRNTIPIKFLIESFGHAGYSVYFQILEYLCESKENKILFNDKMKSFFAKEFKIEISILNEIIETCIDFEILTIENDYLFSNEILLHMEKVKDISNKRSLARVGKKVRIAENKEEIETNKDGIKVIDSDINYFDVMVEIDENEIGKIKNEVNTTKQLDYRQEKLIFSNKMIEHFQAIPEPHYMKNKLEKKALNLIFEIINDGLFTKFSDIEGHLDDLMIDVIKKDNPSFYVTGLYNRLSNEIKEVSKSNIEFKEFSEKFKYLSNSKE